MRNVMKLLQNVTDPCVSKLQQAKGGGHVFTHVTLLRVLAAVVYVCVCVSHADICIETGAHTCFPRPLLRYVLEKLEYVQK